LLHAIFTDLSGGVAGFSSALRAQARARLASRLAPDDELAFHMLSSGVDSARTLAALTELTGSADLAKMTLSFGEASPLIRDVSFGPSAAVALLPLLMTHLFARPILIGSGVSNGIAVHVWRHVKTTGGF